MDIPGVGKLISEKILNTVIGKIFTRSTFSLATLGVVATAGVFGPIAPLALGAMWLGIGAYMAREVARDWIANKGKVVEVGEIAPLLTTLNVSNGSVDEVVKAIEENINGAADRLQRVLAAKGKIKK